MAVINFLVKGKKNMSNILLRFQNGRKFDLVASTDLKVNPKNWSKAKQKVKLISNDATKDKTNIHLNNLKHYIIKEFNNDIAEGKVIDTNWLKNKIATFFKRPSSEQEIDKVFFVPFIKKYIELSPNRFIKGKGKPVSKSTITKYNTTLKKLEKFEQVNKTKIKLAELNLTFYRKFVAYLSETEKINSNTIGKYIRTIKSIARDARLQGLPVHEHIEHPKFFAPTAKVTDIYLNDQEINTIFDHDFSDNERLDNARDLFIIGLRTGLRISDFLRLKQTNIKEGYIEIETQKTRQNVVIPMHPQVKEILKKRDGFPNKISDQKFNLYIKEIAKKVGLTQKIEGSKINSETKRKQKGIYPKHELVTSHICRRSFASNLYGKLPNMVIMAVTGHQTEAQFLKYIKITPKENAQKLQEYWQRQQEENSFETLKMKVVK
jgi:integrase